MFTRQAHFKIHPVAFLAISWMFICSPGATAQNISPDKKPEPITGIITGQVVNENGQPFPNALVYAVSPVASMQRMATTDSGGSFKFDGLDSALYLLFAAAPGYVMPARAQEAEPDYHRLNDSVTLRLTKGGVITGTVVSASGEPVVQVAVRATLVLDANGRPPKSVGFQLPRATDDRGIYRIYGLPPGTYVVSAGGRNSFGGGDAYDQDAPTYAPSSTRDTAAQISINGDETNVDIKYRGDTGHAVSGSLTGLSDASSNASFNISLMQIDNAAALLAAVSFAPPGANTFSLYGVADGDYELTAQSFSPSGVGGISEPRRISVKGADVTGIVLNIKPLGSISGQVALAKSELAECKNKRQPLFSEILIATRRKELPSEPPRFYPSQGVPEQSGAFQIRSLTPGQYSLSTRFFAKYWFLKSIVQQTGATAPAAAKGAVANNQNDLARNGVTLKSGENISRVTVTLAEGAASFHGSLKLETGQTVPPKLFVYLMPAEKESAEDVLRFFASEVGSDGVFALNNLPPGRYWALGQISSNNEPSSEMKLRLPAEADVRAELRRAAEAGKLLVELKPCQNMIDYQLPVSLALGKN